MNDFTKEELETIVDAFNHIYGAPEWRTTSGWDDELQAKIQSMIDNYCEHKDRAIDIGEAPIICNTCGKVVA
jgi:hypothetical protein